MYCVSIRTNMICALTRESHHMCVKRATIGRDLYLYMYVCV